MSFLYRSALTITRKQPYIDWANGLDDGGQDQPHNPDNDLKTVYLVPEFSRAPELSSVLDACWQDIFGQELAMWSEEERDWPEPRTREMFDEWFAAEFTMSVYDLVVPQGLKRSNTPGVPTLRR
jgi:hypothetical protein